MPNGTSILKVFNNMQLTRDEIKQLPNLQEVVDFVLQEERKRLDEMKPPQIVVEDQPSAIHKPLAEYFNDFDERIFIAVRLSSRDPQRPEKFAFKPNMKNRAFLFRGQSGFYDPSTPSLMRKTEGRYVVENIFYEEFVMALKDHPLIQMFWNGIELGGHRYFFEVNFYGLAQHYGLKTSVMDLTSDVDVAKFFAVTDYDEKNDAYRPVLDESRYGVFYYWDNVHDPLAFAPVTGGNLSNIGLQVFPRSGMQRGFLYSMFRNQNFHDCPFVKYKLFRHDEMISRQIFKNAKKGKIYFPKDELSSLAMRIRNARRLSGKAFCANMEANPKDDVNRNYADCKAAGVDIDFMKPHITFNAIEKDIFRQKMKGEFWQHFCNKIIFPNDRDGCLMQEFRDLPKSPKYKSYFEWK